jgi:hypothetical protein
MLLRSLGERIKGGVALRSLPRLRTYINGVEPVLQQSVVRPLLARDVPPLYKRVSQVRHLRRMAATRSFRLYDQPVRWSSCQPHVFPN